MPQNRRLNRSLADAVAQRLGALPRFAGVARPFHVHAPAAIFRRAAAKQATIGEENRLILYWPGHVGRKPFRLRPGSAAVGGPHQHAPPGAWARPDLIEQ